MISLSRQTELMLGEQQFEQMKRSMARQLEPSYSRNTQRVQRVGKRIAQVTEMKDCNWEFQVFQIDEVRTRPVETQQNSGEENERT